MNKPASFLFPLEPGGAADPIVGACATLRRVEVPAGRVAERHSHTHEQFLLITSGSGILECQAGEVVLAPGVVVHLPAGAWHSAVFATATVVVEVNLPE